MVLRVDRGHVSGEGLRLSYLEWRGATGGGLPVVLLHGLAGSAAGWERVGRRLATCRRVVALDARGHGDSDWSGDALYTGDAHFADVSRALDALRIDRCVLVGFSMGGGVAILTAGALPDRVAGLVVVDAYPAPEMTPGSRRIAEFVASAFSAGHELNQEDGLVRGRPGFDPAIARAIAGRLMSGDAERLDLWPLWEALRCPTLLIRGELSDVLPPELAGEMIARQPRARLRTAPAVAHRIVAERPDELVDSIDAFVRGLPQ